VTCSPLSGGELVEKCGQKTERRKALVTNNCDTAALTAASAGGQKTERRKALVTPQPGSSGHRTGGGVVRRQNAERHW